MNSFSISHNPSALSMAMQHLADRLHTRIDMMLNGNLEQTITLSIKSADKAVFADAMKGTEATASPIMRNMANAICEINLDPCTGVGRLPVSYVDAEHLFNELAQASIH